MEYGYKRNVIVYEEGGETFVSTVFPAVAMSMVDNPSLLEIAEGAEEELKKAIDVV